MSNLQARLAALSPQRLKGIRRGIEKESLRATPEGSLALTPHPQALGSALTHPHITTDYSEAQLELITGVHADARELPGRAAADPPVHLPRAAATRCCGCRSMPCNLPADENIPIGRYGSSNVGPRQERVPHGPGATATAGACRPSRASTTTGRCPACRSEQYFALIRNFRRHAFLLLYLFGASPAVCSQLRRRPPARAAAARPTARCTCRTAPRCAWGGWATRATRRPALAVSYNSLDGYAASLQEALTQPYPAYEAVGIVNPGGEYNQLATSLLQIENEFYGTIRPKRVIRPGERPLHALRERGVEYVEVRLLDLEPVRADRHHGADHALPRRVPAALPAVATARPTRRRRSPRSGATSTRRPRFGREPGLVLERGGSEVPLTQWGAELMESFAPHRRGAGRGAPDHRLQRCAARRAGPAAGARPAALAPACWR